MRKFGAILLVIVTAVGGLLGLSACSQISELGQAEATPTVTPTPPPFGGRLTAEGEVVPIRWAVLSFSAGGIVVDVFAEEGDMVEKDDVIAYLDGKTELEAALAAAELALLNAQQTMDNLYENAEIRRAAAQLALAEAESALERAQDRLDSREFKRGTQEQIEGAWANYIVAVENVKDLEEDFEEFEDEPKDDFARANALAELAAARDECDDIWNRWDYLNSEPDELDVAEAEAQFRVAEANLEKARQDNAELQDGVDPDELALAQTQLKNAEAQLIAAKIALTDIEMTAPFDGEIIVSSVKVGEAVSLGAITDQSPAVTLADTSVWKVETTDLTEIDVVDVNEDARVLVTFDAIPELELTGEVAQIEALGVNKQGDITYTVTIALDEMDERLKWKMTANVYFEVE